jgi:hypothetical protein
MNRPDQSQSASESNGQVDDVPLIKPQMDYTPKEVSSSIFPQRMIGFDWVALGVVILISAFFAITARLNAQPATSFVPAAVLSATGCGLLVTAIRKLRISRGVGFLEALLGGLVIALFQLIVAITYPGVLDSLSLGHILRDDFLITWGLVASFSIVFSAAGAALGHLTFAPLRPLPVKSSSTVKIEENDNYRTSVLPPTSINGVEEESLIAIERSGDVEFTDGKEEQETPEDNIETSFPQQQRSFFSYLVTILLLGLAPTVVAYVFSAAYDFTLSFNQFIPGPYPTLRLLSALLPWQVPLSIDLSNNIRDIIIFSLLWRIPLFLGNPTPFDLQALEPYIFNGAALGLLLLTVYRQNSKGLNQFSQLGWMPYLLLEMFIGLILVLPANLWVLRGLEGVLQVHGIFIPIRTLSILTPLSFILNLITGPLMCIGTGLVLRKFHIGKRATCDIC